MLDDIYNQKILELAGNIPGIGHLDQYDATSKQHSKLCGSTVVVDLCAKKVDGELVVTHFAHDVKACALGQASSSIMAHNIIGASGPELKKLQTQMRSMLKDNGSPPEGRFGDYQYLEPVREYKARHASTMLTIEAVVDCITQIEQAAENDKPLNAENSVAENC
jgi:NifU-like protein involved in Fe-S cluster formation